MGLSHLEITGLTPRPGWQCPMCLVSGGEQRMVWSPVRGLGGNLDSCWNRSTKVAYKCEIHVKEFLIPLSFPKHISAWQAVLLEQHQSSTSFISSPWKGAACSPVQNSLRSGHWLGNGDGTVWGSWGYPSAPQHSQHSHKEGSCWAQVLCVAHFKES